MTCCDQRQQKMRLSVVQWLNDADHYLTCWNSPWLMLHCVVSLLWRGQEFCLKSWTRVLITGVCKTAALHWIYKKNHHDASIIASGISIRHPIPSPSSSTHDLVAFLWGLTKWQTKRGGRPAAGHIRNALRLSRVTKTRNRFKFNDANLCMFPKQIKHMSCHPDVIDFL